MGIKRVLMTGGGIDVQMDSGKRYRFDGKAVDGKSVHCVSHAHTDHLPSRLGKDGGTGVITSPETHSLLKSRLRRKNPPPLLDIPEHMELHDSGHVIGSRMFHALDADLLFTGDFSTRRRFFTEGARPVKCKHVIIEATFAAPGVEFPPHEEVFAEARQYVLERLEEGKKVLIDVYPLGKAQEAWHIFEDMGPQVSPNVRRIHDTLNLHGHFFPGTDDMYGSKQLLIGSYMRGWEDAVRVGLTGWAQQAWPGSRGFDRAFPLSDHADWNEFIGFLQGCSPERVYLWHTGVQRTSKRRNEVVTEIEKQVGAEVVLLKENQAELGSYF